MSLTKQDLKAIKSLIDESNDALAIQVAQGFDEVHKKIDGVEDRLGTRIEKLSRQHDQTLDQVHRHDVRISELEKQPV